MRVALIATIKNVEIFLPHTLFIVDEIRNRCNRQWPHEKCYIAFFENDSSDRTLEYVTSWAKNKRHVNIISHPKLDERLAERTQRLAFGRNKLREALQAEKEDGEFDRVIVMDMDDVCTFLDVDLLFTYLLSDFTGILVKCSNSSGRHSDLWALRGLGEVNPLCASTEQGAVDWDRCDRLLGDSFGIDKTHLTTNQLGFRQGSPAVEVDSCFNHLAIYNGRVYAGDSLCKYDGMIGPHEECEHVPFNCCMRKEGYSVLVEPDFLVQGLEHPIFVHNDMARPIASRNLPFARGIFSWSKEYSHKNTDDLTAKRFFTRHWNGKESWVWVRAGNRGSQISDITLFADEILPILKHPIVLLTGDGDLRVPVDLPSKTADALLCSPYVACWLAENCQLPGFKEGKLQALPKGLSAGQHQLWASFPPPARPHTGSVALHRKPNDDLSNNLLAIEEFPHVTIVPQSLTQAQAHEVWKKVDFVAFLDDEGTDSHRIWEVLCLNRIPVVQRTSITEGLFQHLPVILSDDPLAEIADVAALGKKSKSLLPSSCLDLSAGLWLGRAAGRGARPIWENTKADEASSFFFWLTLLIIASCLVFLGVWILRKRGKT
jgi:hypothetical protein